MTNGYLVPLERKYPRPSDFDFNPDVKPRDYIGQSEDKMRPQDKNGRIMSWCYGCMRYVTHPCEPRPVNG